LTADQAESIVRLFRLEPQLRASKVQTGSEDEAIALLQQQGVKSVTRFEGGETSVDSVSNSLTISRLRRRTGSSATAGVDELESIAQVIEATEYGDRVIVDPSVVRGLEYYTGAVFEAELTFEVKDDAGRPVRFGSVGGGGRYDGLVGRFMKDDVPATGFSIGVSRLQAALAALNQGAASDAAGPAVVLVMDRERVGDYQALVSRLRNAGVAAEMYLGSSGMKAQMKYADRRNAPLVVIQGGDEKARGMVQIKDMRLGKELAENIAGNAEWRGERPGQFEVPEAELIEAVKQIVGLL
jgi:histidyl-tRNA synthetase